MIAAANNARGARPCTLYPILIREIRPINNPATPSFEPLIYDSIRNFNATESSEWPHALQHTVATSSTPLGD